MLLMCCYLLLASISPNTAPVPLSFQKLEGLEDYFDRETALKHLEREFRAYNHHEVTMRGFLYQDKEKRWLLSAEPNLKSCCLGTSAKIATQVVVLGEIQEPSFICPVTVEGKFKLEPQWDSEGNLKQIYCLEQAKVHCEQGWPMTTWVFASFGIGSFLYAFRLMRKKVDFTDE